MTNDKIIAILNKIREDQDLSYQNAVPKVDEKTILSQYGAVICGNPYIKNAFLNNFMNYFMYEETKQHIFESEFDRLKNPTLIARYGSFEAFRNTIKPMDYNEEDLARILKLYKPDVKTAYFARNRQDIFPMSIIREELIGAFADFEKFDSFVTGLYESIVNSNKVVEYNAIKECINVNVQGGAIKKVIIPTINSSTSASIAKMIRAYVTRMQKPSTQYNAYIDMEGATGEAVETQTPKQALLLIADSDTIAEISIDVLASAFNLAYADFQINLIELDDFGYNVYDRNSRTIVGRQPSNIKFMICDEALFKIEDNLDVTAEGTNDATLAKQVFYHIWQTIQVRPWANAIAFCYAETTEVNIDGHTLMYDVPVNVTYEPSTATILDKTQLTSSRGTAITTATELTETQMTTEQTDIDVISAKIEAVVLNGVTKTTDTGIITYSTTNRGIEAGEYTVSGGTYNITSNEIAKFYETYGEKSYIKYTVYPSGEDDNVEYFVTPICSKSAWQS